MEVKEVLETYLRFGAQAVAAVAEVAGVAVIAIAIARTLFHYVLALVRQTDRADSQLIRIDLGRSLALALEFQLAADILNTAVAPSWEEIGKLAAIAAIRTGLNYFLQREIAHESQHVTVEEPGEPARAVKTDPRTAHE